MIKLIDLLNEIKSLQYQIYCDMDGVLADFDKGYKELTGIDLGGKHTKGDAKFWKPISDAGSNFWLNLDWMSGGKALWNYIKQYDPIILSAPSREKSSEEGKRGWIDQEIGPDQKVIFKRAKEKHHYSDKNKILIDDKPETIDSWNNAGGIGILYNNTPDTIKQLKKLGL